MERFELNPALGVPIYRQLMDQIREQIVVGRLRPGDQLPSVRELAATLRINPASAVKAYGELRHLGLIVQDQGRGTFVSASGASTERSRDELLHREAVAFVGKASTWGFDAKSVQAAVARALAKHADRSDREEK